MPISLADKIPLLEAALKTSIITPRCTTVVRFLFRALLALGECGLMQGQTRPGPLPNLPAGPQPPNTHTRPDSVGDNGPY